MTSKFVLAAGFSLAASMAMAEQTTEALISVLADNDCSVSQPRVAGLFAPLGFTPQFVKDTLTAWIVDGVASEDARGVLSLPSDICPPETPAPTPYASILDRFRDNDCRMGADDIDATLSDLGLSEAQLRAVVTPLVQDGSIAIARSTATLQAPLCGVKD